MAKVKFEVFSESSQSPIYLRFSIKRGVVPRRKTGLVINSKDWSVVKGLPKQSTGENKNISNSLKKLEVFVLERFNESNAKGELVNNDWLQFTIDLFFKRVTENKQSDLLQDSITNIIDNANLRENVSGGLGLSKSRINSYKSLLKMVQEFQKSKLIKTVNCSNPVKVKEVNVLFAKTFLKFLVDEDYKGYKKSYATKKISDLKTVCYDAEVNGVESSFQLKKIKAPKQTNTKIVYLTRSELLKIEEAILTKESLINARKWLVLGCSIGQRGGDLLSLTEGNFINRNGLDVIELKQQKTNKNITIPVLATTKRILEDGLPYKISIQKLNTYIKEVCKIAGIDEMIEGDLMNKSTKRKEAGLYPKYDLITSHVCRRSFATNLYGELPTPLIMQVTGHSTEAMLLNYIGKTSLDYAQQIADFYTLQAQKETKESQLKVVYGKTS